MDVTIRPIREEELAIIIGFFNEEGWNVSLKSVSAIYRYQPDAFNVAETAEAKVIGDIMGITINEKFGFGTGFIVSKEYRRQGIGKKLWQRRWDNMKQITWGVDAAPRRLEPNQNLGFSVPECAVTVYSGQPSKEILQTNKCKILESVEIKEVDESLFPQLVKYDGKMNHAGEREDWLRAWLGMEDSHCAAAVENGKIVGCGELHPAQEGYAFGHWYADNANVAFMVMRYLIEKIGWEESVSVNLPALNEGSKSLVESFGLKEYFTAHRMWTKPLQTSLPYQHIFGFPEIAP